MRIETEKIHQQKVNQVIDYISANLHQPLSLEIMAGLINVSQRQLLRIMHSSLNESLSTYVSRQRIERAVMYMQSGEASLTEIAEKVGYDNPQSFSKAFKKQFGISPKAYLWKLQQQLESSVTSNDGQDYSLQVEVHENGELNLIYIRIFGEYGEKELYENAWKKLIHFLKSNNDLSDNTRFIGISFDDPNVTQAIKCRFYACATLSQHIQPTGEFGIIRIPRGNYAVYTIKDNYSSLQETYNHINANFNYKMRHGMAFEEYLHSTTEVLITKIYIPIY